MGSHIIDIHLARTSRGDAKLEIEPPGGTFKFVNLRLTIRTGTRDNIEVMDQSVDFTEGMSRSIPAAKLQAAEEAFVDTIVYVFQPAKLTGTIQLKGHLTLNGTRYTAESSIPLVNGAMEAPGTLTWWVKP